MKCELGIENTCKILNFELGNCEITEDVGELYDKVVWRCPHLESCQEKHNSPQEKHNYSQNSPRVSCTDTNGGSGIRSNIHSDNPSDKEKPCDNWLDGTNAQICKNCGHKEEDHWEDWVWSEEYQDEIRNVFHCEIDGCDCKKFEPVEEDAR